MKILFLALALSACSAKIQPESLVPLQAEAPVLQPTAALSTPVERASTEAPAPSIQRNNFLLLGRDWRAHREGTGRGYQTDVMLLVSVLESDPLQITVIQYPRNFYSPVSPRWLFSVWKDEGWQGLHDYWREAFGVELQGIFLVTMDDFVKVTNDLGMDGEALLSFLRDNENNWGHGSYDYEQRTFSILQELWSIGKSYFLSNPIVAINSVVRWSGYFESDLNFASQLVYVFDLGWKVRSSVGDVRMVQLEAPALRWDTVPGLNVPRGWVANTDLVEWHACVLDWSCDAGTSTH